MCGSFAAGREGSGNQDFRLRAHWESNVEAVIR